ncbi:hypothetical protein ACE1MS_22950 (plasmid) [Lysinibacillus sp. fkY74-1]
MRINWKVQVKHMPFLVGSFSLLLLLIQHIGALFGVVSDPTTPGLNDSERV